MCLFFSIVSTRSLERFICVLPTSCRNSRTEASYPHCPRHKKLKGNMGINWSFAHQRLSKSISSIIRMVREELFHVILTCSCSALPSFSTPISCISICPWMHRIAWIYGQGNFGQTYLEQYRLISCKTA